MEPSWGWLSGLGGPVRPVGLQTPITVSPRHRALRRKGRSRTHYQTPGGIPVAHVPCVPLVKGAGTSLTRVLSSV